MSTPDPAGLAPRVVRGCPRLLRPRALEKAGALLSIARLTWPSDLGGRAPPALWWGLALACPGAGVRVVGCRVRVPCAVGVRVMGCVRGPGGMHIVLTCGAFTWRLQA
eukprot:5859183-Alexandrium_andersonii.AAC.1